MAIIPIPIVSRKFAFGALLDAASVLVLSISGSVKPGGNLAVGHAAAVLSETKAQWNSIILGGFLQATDSYYPYATALQQAGFGSDTVNGSESRIHILADGSSDSFVANSSENRSKTIGVGHSKGGKILMASILGISTPSQPQLPKFHAAVFVEPVDLDPPNTPPERQLHVLSTVSSNASHDLTLASIPTLVIAAPYSGYSTRYGPMKNLCAPPGTDARAFYNRCALARKRQCDACKGSDPTVPVAPLYWASLPHCGHNDVVRSSVRGCARGKEAEKAPDAVGAIVALFWSRVVLAYYESLAERSEKDDQSMRILDDNDDLTVWENTARKACEDLGVTVELLSYPGKTLLDQQ